MQTGGIDPVTGDCSMSANGIWIENGELKQPVGGVTIATSLEDFLMNVTDVGNDMMFGGTVGVPTLRIDNVTVGGADLT
jgi:PmbA protein